MSIDASDYIIIGAGSAGCAAANRLSENADVTVLVLEAGGPDVRPEIADPMGWPALLGSEVDWNYTTVPQPGTAGMAHPWPRGKVLGGTSCLNGMVWMRGAAWDYDTWVENGCEGWDWSTVTAAYRAFEDFPGGDPEYRGTGGPLKIRTVENVNPLTSCFLEACEQRGYQAAGDFNGSDAEGFGLHQLNAYDGQRQSAAVAFLHPVESRENLHVLTGATVRELVMDRSGSRVEEVVYEQAGTLHRVRVQEEVIVAAGAVDSPKLLMLSGIGPAQDLERLGIAVRANLPGVGQNLHDHLAATVTHEATREVPPGRNQNSEAGLYCKSDPSTPYYDLQFAFLHIPFVGPGFTSGPHGFTVFGGILKVLSRGSITLRSADPAVPPLIDPAYLTEEADIQRMLVALEIGRDIASAPAFDGWRGRAVAPGPDVQSEADKRSYVAACAATFFHPVGTCKMGTGDDCVVDPRLMVHGFENLRVADASVIPEIVCANTNAPAMMIGWRVAEMISSRST